MTEIELETENAMSVTFDGTLCIHARHCVIGAPKTFLANVPGAWIQPEATEPQFLAATIRTCPSGALHYSGNAAAAEVAPQVNTVRLRENGPYALHAVIRLPHGELVYRRTLCRCGLSANKPFCDGSHTTVGFTATGEPTARISEPLNARDGEVLVDPLPDGPLKLTGNLEILSGTGRTIDRTDCTYLCRCGASRTKPYCDGSHQRIGFTDARKTEEDSQMAENPNTTVPTLADWAGGREKLAALTKRFYEKIPLDPMLAPVFASMDPAHFQHVASFVAEVFGGGKPYTEGGGSHNQMVSKHLARNLTEAQRRRWIALMLDTADEVGLPDDPEFRSAFVAYLEWGSRLAVMNSKDGVEAPKSYVPMPVWGWGPPGGPYEG